MRRNPLFNKGCWEPGYPHAKTYEVGAYLTAYTKFNSKWTKDLNVRPKIIKLLEENIGLENLQDIGFAINFFEMAQAGKTQTN